MQEKTGKTQGFTLIELIIIIILIGILSVSVVQNWPTQSLNLQFTARQVLNDVRYAQAMSLASGLRYRWTRISATAYQILDSNGNAIVLPSGGTQMNLPGGIQIGTLGNLPGNMLVFDAQGSPCTNNASPCSALAGTATIPLVSATQTTTISILPQTGYQGLQ